MINDNYPGALINVSSKKEYKPAGFQKPGRILELSSRDIGGKIVGSDSDCLGRLNKVETEFKRLSLIMYTVYDPQLGDIGGYLTIRCQPQLSID